MWVVRGSGSKNQVFGFIFNKSCKKKLFEEINLQNTNSEMLIAESSFMYSNVLKDEYSVV